MAIAPPVNTEARVWSPVNVFISLSFSAMEIFISGNTQCVLEAAIA